MKGIILAGGAGTRLHPLTFSVSKQLLPVYDKPMVYYPLSTLMLAGIKDILIITTVEDGPLFAKLLGNGEKFGITLTYAIQEAPNGLAEAFIIGEEFIGGDSVCLILGDNIFYGGGLQSKLLKAKEEVIHKQRARIFGSIVSDPERYGIAVLKSNGQIESIEEKPKDPRSNLAITGLYMYPNSVIEIAKNIEPSIRGELEITDVNKVYFNNGLIDIDVLSRGYAWLDTGTHDSLCEASEFIKIIEHRTGQKIGCLEEVGLNYGWITKKEILISIKGLKGEYYKYLQKLTV
jgi:glucose-1-phosphate thymidylyltransferase